MSKPNPRTANGHRRRKAIARMRALANPCGICGRPIDYNLAAGHPMAFEVDEIVPVSKGGSPYEFENLEAAHRICNQRRGNKPLAVARALCKAMGAAWYDPLIPLASLPSGRKDTTLKNSRSW